MQTERHLLRRRLSAVVARWCDAKPVTASRRGGRHGARRQSDLEPTSGIVIGVAFGILAWALALAFMLD